MAARDLADAIGHGDNGEAEGGGDAENFDGDGLAAQSPDDGSAAADKHERKGADEFRNCLFHDGVPREKCSMMPCQTIRA